MATSKTANPHPLNPFSPSFFIIMDASAIISLVSFASMLVGMYFGYKKLNRENNKDLSMTIKEKTMLEMRLQFLETKVAHVEDRLIQELKNEIILLRGDIRNILDKIISNGSKN